jgi:hypothetical protein
MRSGGARGAFCVFWRARGDQHGGSCTDFARSRHVKGAERGQYTPILTRTNTGSRMTTNSTGKTQTINGSESLAGSA